MVIESSGASDFLYKVVSAYEKYAQAGKIDFKNNFLLYRGPYIIAATIDENTNKKPLKIIGPVIDLFDPELPVLKVKEVHPGEQSFLYNLKNVEGVRPQILASAARAYDEKFTERKFDFIAKSPSKTINAMRIYLPAKPNKVIVTRNNNEIYIFKNDWEMFSKTLLLKFENYSDGVRVSIHW